MGLLDRVNAQLASRAKTSSRDTYLRPDDYAALFQFGGVGYPILQTTYGSVNQERLGIEALPLHHGNSAIFALTQARIQAFSQVKFQWTRFQGAQQGDLFGSPELELLEHPWPGGTTEQLLAIMETDNCIAGNAYIVNARKGRLARLRPDRVVIVLGSQMDPGYPSDAPDVEVAGYLYYPRSGKPTWFAPEQVAHYAPIPDPYFQFLGMSWITPAIVEVQADSMAMEHKRQFFVNAATPNLAIKFDPTVTLDMVRQFKELMEEEHRSAFNAYKTLFLGGGADPVAIGKDFSQMDFTGVQGHGESRLAAAAGVPSSWVGFSEGLQGSSLNAGNFQSARRRFVEGTLHHLWMCAARSLANVVGPRRDPVTGKADSGATLWFDTRVPLMREAAQDQAGINLQNANTLAQLVRDGFEPDSAVQAVVNDDFTLLKHSGLVSVQLQPPGVVPVPGYPAAGSKEPAAVPKQQFTPATASISGNGSAAGNGKTSSNGSGS